MSAAVTTFEQNAVNVSTATELTMRSKILIGGLGALTPIILNLLVVDLKTTFTTITAVVVLGYLIRVGVLFAIGGGMAYFHKDERNALKLFEIGIVAPALITALMNGTTNIKDSNARASSEPVAVTAGLTDFLIPTAYAQDRAREIKRYTPPKEALSEQLWRGLSGSQDENVWFVVAGTYRVGELQKARELVRKIAQSNSAHKAEIYQNDKYLAVVIGANLMVSDARALKKKASDANIPTNGDIYLYNPWASK
jgi:hypothetical protein